MKKAYEELKLEIIRFPAEDIITASADEEDGKHDPDGIETTADFNSVWTTHWLTYLGSKGMQGNEGTEFWDCFRDENGTIWYKIGSNDYETYG